jgi:hypothetical protein
MRAFTWLGRWFPKVSSSPGSRLQSSRRERRVPLLERLEDRTLLNGGTLDPAFGVGGQVLTAFAGFQDNEADAVAIQQDGKIVVAGYSQQAGLYAGIGLVRYTTTGVLDSTFGNGGIVITPLYGSGDSTAPLLSP